MPLGQLQQHVVLHDKPLRQVVQVRHRLAAGHEPKTQLIPKAPDGDIERDPLEQGASQERTE